MHFRRWWCAAVMAAAAVLAVPGAATATDEKRVEHYLQAFYESALWHDGKSAVWVRKWAQPLRVRLTGLMAELYSQQVLDRLQAITEIAGLEYSVLQTGDKNTNFLIEFVDSGSLVANGRAAGCVTHTYSGPGNTYAYVHILINLRMGSELGHCISHELMHALGFPGHPHGIDSVLSYVHRRDDLTDADKMSLRILYDRRIEAGAFQLPALAVAREVLVDKLIAAGAPDPTRQYGRRFVQNMVPLTVGLAEKGNVGLQYQLGIAYTFGQVVERDPVKGFAWLRRAATASAPEAKVMAVQGQAMVGHAYMIGRGIEKDPTAAIPWYRQAANQGHLAAQQVLGIAYRDGIGVTPDPVEAYKWLTLAAGQKDAEAQVHLSKLTPTLSPSEIEEGRRRASGWNPAP
jgi:hypothetical protein